MQNQLHKKLFPTISILDILPSKTSLFQTVLVAANDELVNLFLKRNISFYEISKNLISFVNLKEFQKYKKINPKNIEDIHNLSNYVRLKLNSFCI